MAQWAIFQTNSEYFTQYMTKNYPGIDGDRFSLVGLIKGYKSSYY